MPFKNALWDGSDPSYAPCIRWAGSWPYWTCPAKYLAAGYSIKRIALPPGDPDDDLRLERARLCRLYTQDLVRWFDSLDVAKVPPGTWKHLIARYKTDQWSPYQGVKANTKQGYDGLLARWENAIGHLPIGALDYASIRGIESTMRAKGRSTSNIRRMFTMLRTVAKYGRALRIADAREVSEILSDMTFASSAPRSVAPTRDQVEAMVNAADKAGAMSFAAGLIIMFEFSLRAVDVRGQWLPDDGRGGIVRNGKRWQDGLTWDMFDADLTRFRKVISKTAKSLPEPYTFDLTPLPDLRRRLSDLRPRQPAGPVIVTGRYRLPYDRHAWANAFRRFRVAAGVPDDVQCRDLRAGGLTEASSLGGVDPMWLRDAAQHTQTKTTERYVRSRSDAANKVVALRNAARTSRGKS